MPGTRLWPCLLPPTGGWTWPHTPRTPVSLWHWPAAAIWAWTLADAPAVALGGSFSSAIVNRLLRDERDQFAAWLTLGGISNAFTGSADFYAGRLTLPERFRLVIPALGPANIYPLPFLYFSPVYTASHLPPTMIIHTDVDKIIPIGQAYEMEKALRAAGVPVDVLYYEDVSHYLQIGEDLTESGEDMFWQVLTFLETHTGTSGK